MSATTKSPVVSTRTYSWLAMVERVWGEEWNKHEVVYEMSGGRKFESTDHTSSGVYERG